MIEIKNPYDFYSMTEDERIALVGEILVEHRGTPKDPYDCLYFPVWLADGEFNYDRQQGLISVHYVCGNPDNRWLGVHAFSPDDLDIDLNFTGDDCKLRDQVVEFLAKMDKVNVTYRGVLTAIYNRFKDNLTNEIDTYGIDL